MKKVLDPDPAGQKSTDPTGSGSSSLVRIYSCCSCEGVCGAKDGAVAGPACRNPGHAAGAEDSLPQTTGTKPVLASK